MKEFKKKNYNEKVNKENERNEKKYKYCMIYLFHCYKKTLSLIFSRFFINNKKQMICNSKRIQRKIKSAIVTHSHSHTYTHTTQPF